jgi:hypothetical protein
MYILFTLLHVPTTQDHLQVTFFFQGIYRTAHNVTRTLKYVVVINLVLNGVPSSFFFILAAQCTIGCTTSWSCVSCIGFVFLVQGIGVIKNSISIVAL